MDDKVKGQASSQARPSDEQKFSDRLNVFLRKNRVLIMIVAAAVALAVLGLGVWSLAHESALNKATAALEAVEADYDAYLGAAEGEKSAKADAILAAIETIQKRYPKAYAGLRAAVVKAKILYDRKDLAGAESAYAAMAAADPDSHLAPVGLVNAAAMAEERGDLDAAIAHLEAADSRYPDAPGSARVLFSIGRMYEAQKQYTKAAEAYTRVTAKGGGDDWTKLSRDRIIFLRAQGLIQ